MSYHFFDSNNVSSDFITAWWYSISLVCGAPKRTKSQSRRCPDHFRRFCGPCPLQKKRSRNEWRTGHVSQGKTNYFNELYLESHKFCPWESQSINFWVAIAITKNWNWLIFTHIRCPCGLVLAEDLQTRRWAQDRWLCAVPSGRHGHHTSTPLFWRDFFKQHPKVSISFHLWTWHLNGFSKPPYMEPYVDLIDWKVGASNKFKQSNTCYGRQAVRPSKGQMPRVLVVSLSPTPVCRAPRLLPATRRSATTTPSSPTRPWEIQFFWAPTCRLAKAGACYLNLSSGWYTHLITGQKWSPLAKTKNIGININLFFVPNAEHARSKHTICCIFWLSLVRSKHKLLRFVLRLTEPWIMNPWIHECQTGVNLLAAVSSTTCHYISGLVWIPCVLASDTLTSKAPSSHSAMVLTTPPLLTPASFSVRPKHPRRPSPIRRSGNHPEGIGQNWRWKNSMASLTWGNFGWVPGGWNFEPRRFCLTIWWIAKARMDLADDSNQLATCGWFFGTNGFFCQIPSCNLYPLSTWAGFWRIHHLPLFGILCHLWLEAFCWISSNCFTWSSLPTASTDPAKRL